MTRRLTRPLLIFDGDCEFCRTWIARWRVMVGDAVDMAPFQSVASSFQEIDPQTFREAVVLVEPDGRTSRGAEAVFGALAAAPGRGLGLWAYQRLPGFAFLSERAYRIIAAHRPLFLALTRLLWGHHVVPPGERRTTWLFLRLLALVYLTAFASLSVQIVGLAGREGLLPIGSALDSVARQLGPERYWLMPTLCWMNAGDGFLQAQCVAGAVGSLLLLAGVAPAPMLIVLWALYRSVATAGQEFLWFQWDSLLLETGFLAVFVAPWRPWAPRPADASPPALPLWMLRWLLVRVMFCSAVVKLSSGDAAWRNLTALQYHFETQPLPPWTAWYAHHLPAGLLRATTAAMFAVEGLAPWLALAPRRPRIAGAALLAGFQVLIFVTGNYGFFNILTVTLCVMLLDDGVWPRRFARGAGGVEHTADADSALTPRRRTGVSGLVLVPLFVLSLVPFVRSFRTPARWLDPLLPVYRAIAPLDLVNSYGLFAVMTTRRPEIVVEGSDDGVTWTPYVFHWKPGDPMRRPEFVAPHHPRLDWQMWFAALGAPRVEPWLVNLCGRLLEGSRPVLALLARDPFGGRPPRMVRATLYDYRFSDPATKSATGAWWVREPVGSYIPPISIVDGRLMPVEPDSLPRPTPGN